MDEFATPGRGFSLGERKFDASFQRPAARCNSLIQRDLLRRLGHCSKSGKRAARPICNGLHKLLRRKTFPPCILERGRSLKCQGLRGAGARPQVLAANPIYWRTQDLRLATTISLDPGLNSKV